MSKILPLLQGEAPRTLWGVAPLAVISIAQQSSFGWLPQLVRVDRLKAFPLPAMPAL